MNYELILGDCLQTLKTLPAASVQTCVTSPPYYGLRDYGHDGQIGLEETPEQYVAKLVDVFREVRRVLRDDATLWLNLGDSYYNYRPGAQARIGPMTQLSKTHQEIEGVGKRNNIIPGVKEKDLIGIPWMVAFALRADGWWLRSDIIWHKPNPMPESVTDRPTKAHEYIFLLSKSQTYFYDADAIREEKQRVDGRDLYREAMRLAKKQGLSDADIAALKRAGISGTSNYHAETVGKQQTGATPKLQHLAQGETGRNRRSVWTVTTKPYSGAHFATFPPDLIEPCILAGTSAHGACSECGAPWERITEREGETTTEKRKQRDYSEKRGNGGAMVRQNLDYAGGHGNNTRTVTTLGWQPSCACNADVVPCTVLDPFNGSGTTGAVALKHGRRYIGLELNAEYIELSHKRIGKSQPMLLLESMP